MYSGKKYRKYKYPTHPWSILLSCSTQSKYMNSYLRTKKIDLDQGIYGKHRDSNKGSER